MQLSPTTEYIRTDSATLLAYLLAIDLLCPNWNWLSELKIQGDLFKGTIELREINHRLINCTKDILNQQIQGVHITPQLTLRDGSIIRSPVQSPDDLCRGGWVLAVVVSDGTTFGRYFDPRYIAPEFSLSVLRLELVDSKFYHDLRFGSLIQVPANVHASLQRVGAVLEHILLAAYPKNVVIASTLATVRDMQSCFENYESEGSLCRIDYVPVFDKHGARVSVDANHLEGMGSADSQFILQLFNRSAPLTEDEISRVKPLLLPICRTALAGIYYVVCLLLC